MRYLLGVKKFLLALSLIFVSTSTYLASAKTPEFSECLLPRSNWNIVSLGAPLAPERLGNKSTIRLGVIPFRLSDKPAAGLSQGERMNYLQAASTIEKLSDGKVKVEIVFYPTVNTTLSFQQASSMVQQRDTGWSTWDLSKSTFGIVKEVIRDVDSLLNFSNIDGVILENKSTSFGSVAEAFQFFRAPPDLENIKRGIASGYDFSFHRSISTQEGLIDNAILFDSHHGTTTIIHEILHNFGLTDLYGGNASTPALFSVMASNTMTLLNYEKAVLGWLPIDRIKCANFVDLEKQPLDKNVFSLENLEQNQVIVLKINDKEANILEVRQDFTVPSLILYELKQDERPPITVMGTSNGIGERLTLSDPGSIGSSLKSSNLQVMISNISDGKVTLNIVPNLKIGSTELQKLQSQVALNRENALSLAMLKAKEESKSNASAKVKKTIVCKKVKKLLTVKAKNPKCPAGYRLN